MLPANYILAVTISVSVRVRLSVHARRQRSNRKTRSVPKNSCDILHELNSTDQVSTENDEIPL